jgi:hypothetical protein
MIWWRGGGLWILFLAAGPAAAAIKLGATRTAIAYAASAVLIFLLRDVIGRESALFSVPTRFWPPLLLVVALLVQLSPPMEPRENVNLQKALAESRESFPRVLGEQIRVVSSDFDKKTLHFGAKSVAWFDGAGPQRAELEGKLRRHYCESAKGLWQSNVGVAMDLSVPPRSINDKVQNYAFAVEPAQCGTRRT